ncbi:hypothetical protein H920_04083 [Fukomys damarensis]|uniref:Uncharacterized protein n=1 Tax=Fukomys damarensis TaxID=885580 RepID=A0A091DQU3_FUKDA|nr:hypothetical protein H920_04083 [Fukomys damarensis]
MENVTRRVGLGQEDACRKGIMALLSCSAERTDTRTGSGTQPTRTFPSLPKHAVILATFRSSLRTLSSGVMAAFCGQFDFENEPEATQHKSRERREALDEKGAGLREPVRAAVWTTREPEFSIRVGGKLSPGSPLPNSAKAQYNRTGHFAGASQTAPD